MASRSPLELRLFIAAGAPNSVAALRNLRAYLDGLDPVLEIVDVLACPARALAEGILVTPTLVRLSPLPVRRIIGDLSRADVVRPFLDGERS